MSDFEATHPLPVDGRPLDAVVAEIAEQAATGTCITPSAGEWARALPELEAIACEWSMPESIGDSHLWYEDGAYRAANLPSGLEDREGRPLDRYEAEALLAGISHQPVGIEEVPDDAR